MRGKRDVESCAGRADRRRRHVPFQARTANDVVEASIRQLGTPLDQFPWQSHAPSGARGAANLEDVGEVRVEFVVEGQLDLVSTVVGEADALVQRAVPQESGPKDVDQILGQRDMAIEEVIAIGEVRAELEVVGTRARTEQERTVAVQPQLEHRQESRAVVIQTLLAEPHAEDVSHDVEHRERIAVLQDRVRSDRARRRREDVVLVFHFDDVGHAHSHAEWRCGTHVPPARLR